MFVHYAKPHSVFVCAPEDHYILVLRCLLYLFALSPSFLYPPFFPPSSSSSLLPSLPPPSLQAATGEIISVEDLGGANVHCSISGCTDHFVESEEEGFEMARKIVTSLNLAGRRERREEEMAVGEDQC